MSVKNIDKFYNLFTNLDKSYLELKDKLNVKDRVSFYYKIIKTDTGDSLIPIIRNLLQKEVRDYNNEEMEKYSQLMDILKFIELNLDSIDEQALNKSLDAEIYSKALRNHMESKIEDISKDGVFSLLFNSLEVFNLSTKNNFMKNGEFVSFSKMFRGKLVSVDSYNDFDEEFVVITTQNLNKSFEAIKSKCNEGSEFYNKLREDLASRLKSENYKCLPLVYCSEKYFTGSKLMYRKIKELSDGTYMSSNTRIIKVD